MNITATLVIHELLCVALFYGAFCRAVLANKQTKRRMRFVIVMTGSVASLGMLAPVAWHYEPDWFALLLLATSVTAQLIASPGWREGIPHQFQRESHESIPQ